MEDKEKKKLLSFLERKEMAKKLISNSKNKENFLEAFNYYDIDENINKDYLLLLNNINDNSKEEEFNRLCYTLKDKDRIEIKNILNIKNIQKSSIEIFNNILNLLMEKDINLNIFEKSLQKENFISNQDFKIPFYEGNEEYFYAGLVNQFYYYLCVLKNEPEQDTIVKEGKNFYSTFNFANETRTLKKENFINKTIAEKIKENDFDENVNNISDNEDNPNEQNIILGNNQQEEIFEGKINVLKPFIQIYLLEEFNNKLNELKTLQNFEKIKKIYPIFLLHILIIYCGFNIINDIILTKSLNIFYEESNVKKTQIEKFLNCNRNVKIIDKNNKDINLDDIRNETYVIKNKNECFEINFYDYILYNNLCRVTFNKLKEFTSDIENWTLQKHANENSLFFNKKISNIIEKNIYDSIINNEVLKKSFYEVISFNKYDYPFSNEKIISQIKNATYILPFCCDSVAGLTLKRFGIILINNRIKKAEVKLDHKDWFYYFLLKGMIYKTIFIHELNFHYVFSIIYYNNYSKFIDTPKRLFRSYKVKEGDSGFKGECLIFGNNVKYIFINAALYISNDDEWTIKDDSFEIIANKFLKLNQPSEEDINFESILKKYKLATELNNIIYNEIPISKNIKKIKKNYKNYFCYSNIRDDDDDKIFNTITPEELFMFRGDCIPLNK